jgi:hypothetical protein
MKFKFAGSALLASLFAVILLGVTPSLSQSAPKTTAERPQIAVHDWFAKRKSTVTAQPVSQKIAPRALGNGSYICSPAGFGRKSSCEKR